MVSVWMELAPWAVGFAQAQNQEIPWWVWILLIVFLIFLLWGIWLRSKGRGVVQPEQKPVETPAAPVEAATIQEEVPQPAKTVPMVDIPSEAVTRTTKAEAELPAVEVPKTEAAIAIEPPVVEVPKVEAAVELPSAAVRAATAKLDDLKIIEGIGPKIALILAQAGISTFSKLAATPAEEIARILKESGLRIPADPTTWPDQARLVAEGKLEELQKLQDSLKWGRRA